MCASLERAHGLRMLLPSMHCMPLMRAGGNASMCMFFFSQAARPMQGCFPASAPLHPAVPALGAIQSDRLTGSVLAWSLLRNRL